MIESESVIVTVNESENESESHHQKRGLKKDGRKKKVECLLRLCESLRLEKCENENEKKNHHYHHHHSNGNESESESEKKNRVNDEMQSLHENEKDES